MSHSNATCPQGLMQMETSGVTYCQQTNNGCQGTTFSALGLSYTRVCGRLRGYQRGVTFAFSYYHDNNSLTASDVYVDGASITYGTAMPKHIWTYAAGLSLRGTRFRYECPCNTGNVFSTPPYVGSDYYCETGYNQAGYALTDILVDDPLWDGEQCVGEEAPCCTNNTMPWFNKVLGENTKRISS